MKTNKFLHPLLASVMLAAMTLASCSVEDNPTVNPTDEDANRDEVSGVVFSSDVIDDPLADFMSHFVATNENGQTVHSGYGEALDEADPSVLSISVESIDEADKMFRSFASDESHIMSVAPGNITYSLVKPNGQKQGEIYLTPGTDCIAHITFSDEIPQDVVSEVRFIDQKLWPNNATSPFELGELYYILIDNSGWRDDFEKSLHPERGPLYRYIKASNYNPAEEHTWYYCVDVGGNGKPVQLFRLFVKASFDVDKSYTTDGHKKYGMWYEQTKGKGRTIKNNCAWKGEAAYTTSLKKLQEIAEKVNKSSKLKSIFGPGTGYGDEIVWSGKSCEYWGMFNLYGVILGTQKVDHWRAYTNLGWLSDCRQSPFVESYVTSVEPGWEIVGEVYKDVIFK